MAGKKYLVVIAGPTAVGKTELAIRVAQHYKTGVISADSRQCYREMSIGTARPSSEELHAVPHYFIADHSVFEQLNAGDYEKIALSHASRLFEKHPVAVVCGGTGLYIKALCEGLDPMPEVDDQIHREVTDLYNTQGLQGLQAALQQEDPLFFRDAEQQNPARLLRGLSFFRSHGRSIVHFRSGQTATRDFETIKIGLELPREILYDRINRRVDNMMEQGLLEEVKQLYPYRHLKNLQTVGYSEFWAGDMFPPEGAALERAIELVKQHSRNYSKRQLTWFKKDADYTWFSPTDAEDIIALINKRMARHHSPS